MQNAEPLPILSPEQQRVVDLVVSGKSVFFTGCAGGSAANICMQELDTAAAEFMSLYHTVLYGCLCSTFLKLARLPPPKLSRGGNMSFLKFQDAADSAGNVCDHC